MTDLEARLARLERSSRRWCAAAFALAALALVPHALRMLAAGDPVDTLRAHRIEVVDGAGRLRLTLGEDPEGVGRRAPATGLVLFDESGAERGGFAVLGDGSVVLGLDAPMGVGAAMRDRLGLIVHPDGGAEVRLMDNRTSVPVRLTAAADGTTGIELSRYFADERKVRVRRLDYDGESQHEIDVGGK